MIQRGDALDLLLAWERPLDLVVTDPPYAFSGSGPEHSLTATVAVVLRESATRLVAGSWMLVFCASSWRSLAYAAEATRGILEPVRVGTWTKPTARTKVSTTGWKWASVSVLALRKGKSRDLGPAELLDHITAAPVVTGRRAQLPEAVAEWAVTPFVVPCGVFLDPFAGSGVLVDVATRHGMESYGFEKGNT